jgi:hypothetical protein
MFFDTQKFPSFSRRGSRDSGGVVMKEPRSAPFLVELTNHPVCAAKERDLPFMAQPPLLGKEGNIR